MSDPLQQNSHNDFGTLTAPGNLPLLDNIFQVSDKFLGQLKLHLEQNPPSVPITSVLGFSQFTTQFKTGAFSPVSVSSTTPGDPPDGAFTLTGLPNGKYLFLYGGNLGVPAGGHGNIINLSLNYSAAAATFDSGASFKNTWNGATALQSDQTIPAVGVALYTFTGDNNAVSLYVSVSNAVPTADACLLGNRFIVALRSANR